MSAKDNALEPLMPKAQLVEETIKQEERKIIEYRKYCMSSLYLFNKYVLAVGNDENKMAFAPFHKEICDFVQTKRDRKKIILVPRGHLKSTLITIGYSVFRIVEDRNVRILILNATWQMAVDFLTEIKNQLQKNETLLEVFGDYTQKSTEWSQDRITLNRDPGIKGPTVWAAGVDSNLVGSHPDVIIMDDLVNRDIVESEDMSAKAKLRYKDALDLLEPGGQLIIIGTRWSDSDLYEWILNPENHIVESFDKMIKPAFETDFDLNTVFSTGDESMIRNHLWPEKFNFKELKDRYREKGPYEFSAQYLNDPVPDEAADFHKDWFHYMDLEEWRGRKVNVNFTVDPAISLKKEADFTGVVGTKTDQFGFIGPIYIGKFKIPPDQLIKLLFWIGETFHPDTIGIEMVAFQKVLQYSINEEMRRRGHSLPIVELKTQDRSKDERIRALQPLYANGKILHSKQVPGYEILEDELLRFPRGKHDDVIDAMASQLDLIVPPVVKKSRYHNHYLYGNNKQSTES